MTYTATGDNDTSRSFVYSLNAAGTTAIMPTSVVSRMTHGQGSRHFDISLDRLTGSAGIECRSGEAEQHLIRLCSRSPKV
jgi:hypothetical protein